MNRTRVAVLFRTVLVPFVFSQESTSRSKSPSSQKPELEMQAIVNLRKFIAGESQYAMDHPDKGFACQPQILTQIDWPNSNAKLVEPALLNGDGNYRFSASCPQDSKPGTKLNVLAVPLDPHANLRAFCKTETFGPYKTAPYVATAGSPIRSTSGGQADSCFSAGETLK